MGERALYCVSEAIPSVSMAWLRMPGQSWIEAATSFLGMWTLMMAAMMLPSLAPALQRYRRAAGDFWMTLPVAAGYFIVWASAGLVIYPIGVWITEASMETPARARLAPMATGIFVTLAGFVQFTSWKARYLACCRGEPGYPRVSAWRHGVRHGLHCICCCGNLTAVLLVIGVMDLAVMAAVSAAITFERFGGDRAARAVGVLACAFGLFLVIRAAGP